MDHIEKKVIKNFGEEWSTFDQKINNEELRIIFKQYFNIFPFEKIDHKSIGIDIGCGTGRWARFITPLVKQMYLLEPSFKAINVAKDNLKKFDNIKYFNIDVNSIDIINKEFDFGYSLGVLHHVMNIEEALKNCSKKLKKNAPFLIYLYYDFENRGLFFKLLWKISDLFRKTISIFPFKIKKITTDLIAFLIYLPLKYLYKILKFFSINIQKFPLSFYYNKSFYMMRTDSLDRFGTLLEKRFSKKEIKFLLEKSGFTNIEFSKYEPYWTAICYKK